MIKEKHEKGADTGSSVLKDEPQPAATDNILNKSLDETRIKTEDESASGSSCALAKNGGVIGSTNVGSVAGAVEGADIGGSNEESGQTEPLKTEDGVPTSCAAPGQTGGGGGGPPPPPMPQQQSAGSGPAPPDGVQPLASNVMGKQSAGVDVQYMQQQSQIFVFSTQLANKSADAVFQGHYPSIIAYHCAQPGTKKYLEKNPLKMAQFNRQNPAQWLNNLAMMKSKSCGRSVSGQCKTGGGMDGFLVSDSLDDMVGLDSGVELPWDGKEEDMGMTRGSPLGPSPGPGGNAPSPSLAAALQPSLQGVKVPDENLTPQQRQHREEQLATIRKMQQMLFPEQRSPGGGVVPEGPLDPAELHGLHADWQKLQHQFIEERKGRNPPTTTQNQPGACRNPSTAPGKPPPPPPPYHQTPRSASVPIASPASPNNPTSSLSLPSPRASNSALNSPADSAGRSFGLGRHMSPTSQDSPQGAAQQRNLPPSNPGTPVSAHLSPMAPQDYVPPSATTSSTDGMFGRTLQSLAQQKQNMSTAVSSANPNSTIVSKEPNLMPVPSPQQIQYLNTFEGQELTIQKQPNTSLKDGSIISPTLMDSAKLSGPSTPLTPSSLDMPPRFPSASSVTADGCRFQMPSPQSSCSGAPSVANDKTIRTVANSCLSPRTSCAGEMHKSDMGGGFATSPHSMMESMHRFPGQPSTSPGPGSFGMGQQQQQSQPKPGMGLPGYGACPLRPDNVPLNPNSTSSMGCNPKVSHFDPISSLAQMSQQLTNSVASNLNGQGQPSGMMGFPPPPPHAHSHPHPHSMHMGGVMDMSGCHVPDDGGIMMSMQQYGGMRSLSPKMGGPPGPFGQGGPPQQPQPPRMMGRMPAPGCSPYNGASIQVKPGAPNTIQYMPAKPQMSGPRGPPSLDFLQRFANPGMMGEPPGKMHQQYQHYGQPGNNGHHMMAVHMGDGMPPDAAMGMMNGGGGMMRGMRPPGPMGMMPPMRAGGPPFNGPANGEPPPNMFQGPPPQQQQQMFVSGPKASPGMGGLGQPDASQPLPPSIGQPAAVFKGSPFVGPTTADPNYAQQFHNFQQQLYATTTRSQAMGPGPPPPQPPPPLQPHQPYFVPK